MLRPSRITAPFGLLVAGAALVPVYLLLGSGTDSDVLYLVVMCGAALAACLSARHADAAARPVARMVAAALVLYAIGDLWWSAITWSGGVPDASVADLFYLVGYVVIGATLFLLLMPLRAGRRVIDGEAVIDVATVVSVCVLVLWEFVIRDFAAGLSMATLREQSAVVYPVVDAVLLGLTLRALGHRRVRATVGASFGIGLVCWLLADYVYLFIASDARLLLGANALYMVGALLVATSGARMVHLRTPAADHPMTSSNAARLALAVLPLLVPPGLVVVEESLGRDPESWSLVVGIVVLIGLAFVRTERLLASERRTLIELALARDAALDASRAKTAFLADISHEIRTPMNGVLGLSRLLSATCLDEQQRQYSRGIKSAGESLMTLLNDVLDFAKFETGPVETESLDFDVVEIVEEVAAMVAEQAHHAGLELVAYASPQLPRWLNGDPTRIRQVLLNFAANAVKFTPSGEVVIRASLEGVRESGPVVRFEVSDTGIGIPEADQSRLFEAFTQADASTTRRYGGTGLGLAIVTHIVEALGGSVGISSAPGHGSTFWCTLPLAVARRSQLITTRPSRAVPGTRVLLVDDNQTTCEVLGAQLREWGLQVETAASGESALSMLAANAYVAAPYALVVLDQDMPGMDGVQVAARMHADPALACIPTMMLTSGPGIPRDLLHGVGVGVSLDKPVQLSRLQGAVQRALGTGPAHQVLPYALPARTGPMDRGVVLVVEDSEVNRLVAVGTLRQLGYLTEVAVNGLAAVEAVTSRRYDAVLMDCRMPVMDGYDASVEIRRREGESARTPIIAVTANASPEDRRRCLDAGMDDYVSKPLGRQQVADALSRWVPVTLSS